LGFKLESKGTIKSPKIRVSSGEIGLYSMLQVYVVLQNATIKRTVQMMNALLEKYGQKVRFEGKEKITSFLN